MFTTEFGHHNIPNLAPQESSIDTCQLPQYRQRTTFVPLIDIANVLLFVKSHHIYSLQTRLSRVSTSKTFLISTNMGFHYHLGC